MTTADAIAAWLAARGIRHGFGIIGGGNFVLWDAIARLGKTELVPQHHEQAATMAATAYARATQTLGFALVTTGAGSSNALTGVVAASMDYAPLLVISGNEASKYMHAPARVWGVQGYASSEVATHVTKNAKRCLRAEQACSMLTVLADQALAAPQGPVWLDLPKDIQGTTL